MQKDDWYTGGFWKTLFTILKKRWLFSIFNIFLSASTIFLHVIELFDYFGEPTFPNFPVIMPILLLVLYALNILVLIVLVKKYVYLKTSLYSTVDYLKISTRHRIIHIFKLEKDFHRKRKYLDIEIAEYQATHQLEQLNGVLFTSLKNRYKDFEKTICTNSKSFFGDVFSDLEELYYSNFSKEFELTLKLLIEPTSKSSCVKNLKYFNAFYENKREPHRKNDIFEIEGIMYDFIISNYDKIYFLENDNSRILVPLYYEDLSNSFVEQDDDTFVKKCIGFLECHIEKSLKIDISDIENIIIPSMLAKSETISYYIKDCLQTVDGYLASCVGALDSEQQDLFLIESPDPSNMFHRNY